MVQIPLFKIKLSSLPQPQPSTLACLAYTPFPKHIHCVTAWVIQYPVLGMTSCGNTKRHETVRDRHPFLSTHLNSTHLSRPKITFTASTKLSLVILAHTFTYPVYPISVLLQKSAHSQPCFLTDHLRLNSVQPRFSLHTLLKVLQSHANPMAFSQFSSSLWCLTMQTTTWHPLLFYTSKYYILKVLLAHNSFCLTFLL